MDKGVWKLAGLRHPSPMSLEILTMQADQNMVIYWPRLGEVVRILCLRNNHVMELVYACQRGQGTSRSVIPRSAWELTAETGR